MKKYFLGLSKTALIAVYLVIVAGALVRMTGSGMGCPDWPKCFGYYIPPTDIKELIYQQNRAYSKGQVIIRNEKLWVANEDFEALKVIDMKQWRPYTKHDYAIFDAVETWIEYINRLIGAVAGILVLLMAISSFGHWKTNKTITLLSWFSVFLMGFQGWLGARVVYSVLNPLKITVHMIVALFIVALLLYLIKIAQNKAASFVQNSNFRILLIVALIMSFIQIIIGTQVRQFVDEQVKILGYEQMEKVLQNPMLNFYVHRSFSLLIFGFNFFLWFYNRKLKLGFKKTNWVILLIIFEILTGIAMFYFDFPFGSQAIHLVIASVLFGVQFYLYLEQKIIIASSN